MRKTKKIKTKTKGGARASHLELVASSDVSASEWKDLEREINLARDRLDTKGRARWLLEFAYLDLSQLSQGARADLSYEVAALGKTDDLIGSAVTQLAALKPNLTKLVEDFQKAVRERFDKARAGGDWIFTYPSEQKHLSLFKQLKIRATKISPRQLPETFGVDHLLKVATDLLEKDLEKFGLCQNPRCGRPFVAQRKGHVKFCSPRCSAYVRVTEKLKRDKEGENKK
jgi:hypothetical protein